MQMKLTEERCSVCRDNYMASEKQRSKGLCERCRRRSPVSANRPGPKTKPGRKPWDEDAYGSWGTIVRAYEDCG